MASVSFIPTISSAPLARCVPHPSLPCVFLRVVAHPRACLGHVLQVGIDLSDAEVHAMLDRYDPTGEGNIHYADFLNLESGVVTRAYLRLHVRVHAALTAPLRCCAERLSVGHRIGPYERCPVSSRHESHVRARVPLRPSHTSVLPVCVSCPQHVGLRFKQPPVGAPSPPAVGLTDPVQGRVTLHLRGRGVPEVQVPQQHQPPRPHTAPVWVDGVRSSVRASPPAHSVLP